MTCCAQVSEGLLLNLNVPYQYDVERGLRVSTLGRRVYGKEIVVKTDPRGTPYYWIGGTEAERSHLANLTDCVCFLTLVLEEGRALE